MPILTCLLSNFIFVVVSILTVDQLYCLNFMSVFKSLTPSLFLNCVLGLCLVNKICSSCEFLSYSVSLFDKIQNYLFPVVSSP